MKTPPENSSSPLETEPPKSWSFTTRILIVGSFLCVLLAVFFPRVGSRSPSQRAICINNLRQIGVALAAYQEEFGQMPPAIVRDQDGKPMHSWRVLILPFIGEDDLYQRYDFTKPWDDAANLRLTEQMPKLYRCPLDETNEESFATSYVALYGPKTTWGRENDSFRASANNAAPKTLMVIESEAACTHWMAPHDIEIDSIVPTLKNGGSHLTQASHPGLASTGCNAVYSDGSVSQLRKKITTAELKALTIDSRTESLEE